MLSWFLRAFVYTSRVACQHATVCRKWSGWAPKTAHMCAHKYLVAAGHIFLLARPGRGGFAGGKGRSERRRERRWMDEVRNDNTTEFCNLESIGSFLTPFVSDALGWRFYRHSWDGALRGTKSTQTNNRRPHEAPRPPTSRIGFLVTGRVGTVSMP